jgi:Protein of unknown function (DUF1761)
MFEHLFIPVFAAGIIHFLIGGLWYSPVMFAKPWMHGLGLSDADIKEARVNMKLALLASAFASISQAVMLAWLFQYVSNLNVGLGASIGGLSALAFGFTPMLRDRVWANRPWPVIWVDASYECIAGAFAGGLLVVLMHMLQAT